ncbi:MAG: hypothetical protein VXX29_12735, partial [Verrucomicrobiota bacterium]|nr:hypothetical protein [Verrucomicrobiota bacterium]
MINRCGIALSAALGFCAIFSVSHAASPSVSVGSATSVTASAATVNGALNSYEGADLPTVTLFYDDDQNYSSQRPDPFVPLNHASDLALWLDANDTSSVIQSAGVVSEWRDLSGNGLHLSQSDSSKRPLTGSSTQNGLNVLTFDGDDYLQKASVGFQDEDQLWFV